MLQYALLHLTGYDISIDDIKQFRQLNSKTPGHPEHGLTPGVETTTGPLGQGLANAVGMALAEALLASEFNRSHFNVIDHFTYCFVGDGCMMEGISHEAASLAGTLGLGKLIVFWDDNSVSIDGNVSGWFLDDTTKRFEAYHWQVISNVDGHDSDSIKQAITAARACTTQPSLICCKTIIGFGAPNLAGTAKVHGQALGEAEIKDARLRLNWNYPPFVIPDEIYKGWNATEKGNEREAAWQKLFEQYRRQYSSEALELERRLNQKLPEGLNDVLKTFAIETEKKSENIATRKASQNVLNILVQKLPELIGGSADLSESCLTLTEYSKPVKPHHLEGNYIYYGVREFAMCAIMNGIALYKGFIPYGGTFLTFLDYARNAVRLSALMELRVIFVFTHDSIGLGEDGPTHQPIEHLTMLRATPNMSLWRPCDATETTVAWTEALKNLHGPTSLALSRQTLPHQKRTNEQIEFIQKGGYILVDCQEQPEVILIATGSEVNLAVIAQKKLKELGYQVRVVSMPSTNVFTKQDARLSRISTSLIC